MCSGLSLKVTIIKRYCLPKNYRSGQAKMEGLFLRSAAARYRTVFLIPGLRKRGMTEMPPEISADSYPA